ncbi:hypothetical protein [Actinoplanes sp. NPDC089786]|uniref:hypothetical protein n=1 Tax=Actinoplanes sp. NPDC089786 TaxID=3155185 RepID=UPI003422C422
MRKPGASNSPEPSDKNDNSKTEAHSESRGVRFTAWTALAGVLITLVVTNFVTYFIATNGIKAQRQDHATQRKEQLEDSQREARRAAYTTFLTAAGDAARFEKDFWCEAGKRVNTPTGSASTEFRKCANVSDGSKIAAKLRDGLAGVSLNGSQRTRATAIYMVSAMNWLAEESSVGKSTILASTYGSPVEVAFNIQRGYDELSQEMCEDQAIDQNSCRSMK